MSTSKLILLSLLLFLLGINSGFSSENNKYVQVKVYPESKSAYQAITKLGLEIYGRGDNYLELILNGAEYEVVQKLELRTEVVHEDMAAFFQSRLDPNKDMGGYKTLAEINAYLDQLVANYPTLLSPKMSIGQTIEGRDIWTVKLSDNPTVDEDEPELLFTAAIHCREVITPEVLFYFMEHLLTNYGTDTEITDLVNEREIWFILACNPDGYYYNQVIEPDGGGMWRKNRRNNGDGSYGIDLNRNFGYQWGYDNEGSSPYGSSETYRGAAAFSEPETQNLRDFILSRNFIITVFFHSHGNLILWPWAYEEIYTEDEDIFSTIGDTINGYNGYTPGPPWATLYTVNGGSDDWIYSDMNTSGPTFAITPEVGTSTDNFWPPTNRIQPLIEENLEPCLFLTRIADNVFRLGIPDSPELILPETLYTSEYEVNWIHADSENPAIAYELWEMENFISGIIDSVVDFEYWETTGFTISSSRYSTPPSSFYSGAGDGLNRRLTVKDPIMVHENDKIMFKTWYDIEEDWDYAYVEVSTNGVTYEPIPGNVTTSYNPYGYNLGNGITGSSNGWVDAQFDLDNYVGQTIYIRFVYKTDSYTYEEGFYIDNIQPISGFGTKTMLSSAIVDTFYNISKQTEGEYYYRVRAVDAEEQWSSFSDIKSTTVTFALSCGDTNSDELVNILDVTYLIAYLYKDGPDPAYPNFADVNNSGNINILDITYLIAYLYKNGPDPDCP